METIQYLKDFVSGFNYNQLYAAPIISTNSYVKSVEDSIKHHISLEKRTHIGISELGKPAVLLGMKKLKYRDREATLKNIYRCHLGDVFEALLLETLRGYINNYPLLNDELITQKQANFKGYVGHIDALFGNKLIIEIKTMNSYYWSRFTKYPNDEKGYITQLALYSESLQLPAVWLCLNIETYELALVEFTDVPDELVQEKINRAVAVINALESINTFEELFETLAPPQPETEFFKKQPTGRFLLPESMKYTDFAPVFYQIEEAPNGYGKPTRYVIDYNDYDEAKKALDYLYEIPF